MYLAWSFQEDQSKKIDDHNIPFTSLLNNEVNEVNELII